MFEQAGLPVPDDTEPLTYDAIYALAQDLTKREGDRILVWGYGGAAVDWNIDGCVMSHLAETAGVTPNPYVGVLYNDIFNRVNITANEEAKRAFKYYFDMAAENLIANPLNPSSNWTGQDFADGKVAIVQEGYWFSAMAESDNTRGKVKPLPSPRWSTQGKRLDCPTVTGMVMWAGTQVPEAAWKVFEWYMGKEPAIERAKSGWGVPGLKSMYGLMPQETDFQKQSFKVLMDEIANADCESQWPVDPWGGLWFLPIWNKHVEPALRKQATLDEALKNVEDEVNATLDEQFKRYS
jgi:multiple sugar transport system substrate-binding protein